MQATVLEPYTKKITVFLVQADAGSVNSKPNAKAGISKAKTVVDKNNVHGGSWDMSAQT